MSELIQQNDNCATIRWKLLTGASALALTAYVSSTIVAKAEDADRPTVWIDLGGQMEAMQGLSTPFTAPFLFITPTPDPYKNGSPIDNQAPPRFAFGLDGKVSFQPEDSSWIFSAGIRYSRSHKNLHSHHQSSAAMVTFTNFSGFHTSPNALQQIADTKVHDSERHTILDFSVGKDVGLGMLGHDGTSAINLGVRFAQFSMKSTVDITARPIVGTTKVLGSGYPYPSYSSFALQGHAARSFKGVGPSLSWNGSAAIAGNQQDGELAIDWGINAAMLFGRQKAKTDHSKQGYHFSAYHVFVYGSKVSLYSVPPNHHSTRSRRVTIPNVGGFVGLSVKYPNLKVSIGYRYDEFLKAMDTGIDVRKTSNLTFNGPYASISIGLGD